MRRKLLTAAAAKDAPGEALYEVAKMYDSGAYGMAPNPSKAVQFYEAVRCAQACARACMHVWTTLTPLVVRRRPGHPAICNRPTNRPTN
jgi:hypothetical protein